MNQAQFKEICEAAAHVLQAEASEQDGRCSLSVDDIDLLIDLDEETDVLRCYVDLGDLDSHDRARVCEQLLAINLNTHSNHGGAYAFEAGSARAVFCANVYDTDMLSGGDLAETLRYYVDETAEARRMIANPAMYAGTVSDSHGSLFTGAPA
ncbi:MAG: hypothetical protein EOP82_02415 [Variovorax sp.]|nr:MAG: hypothetical protein EOP82_02415 [Variovorax sp.]